jgi:hypothetical protein
MKKLVLFFKIWFYGKCKYFAVNTELKIPFQTYKECALQKNHKGECK